MRNLSLIVICIVASLVRSELYSSVNPFVSVCRSRSRKSKSSNLLALRGGGDHDLKTYDWRYFVAGGICAATSHGITTPIDVIKTKMQASPEKYKGGVLAAARSIVQAEGVGFLLAGLGPTIAGYGLEGALKFGFYETAKQVFKHLTKFMVLNFLLASIVAGGVASIVLCPMEETRIKMVGDPSWANEGTISGIARLIREGGLLSTFKGIGAMLSKQVPYTMFKQVSFDLFAKFLHSIVANIDAFKGLDLKFAVSLAAGFLASILACLSSQPGDMILTATYKGGALGADKSFGAIVGEIYSKHGIAGFFLGTSARLAHVATIITSQLLLYDIVKVALGLPATGSH